MKKILVLSCLLAVLLLAKAEGGLIFSENVGTGTGTQTYANNVWQNASLSFTGSGDTRTTSASAGYTGASGGKNVFLSNTAGNPNQTLTIGGINSTGFVTGTFSIDFGVHFSQTGFNLTALTLAYSSDGTTFTPLTLPSIASSAGWNSSKITLNSLSLPTVSNLRLRWTNNTNDANHQFRLDDISLSATAVPEPTAMLLVGSLVGLIGFKRRR